MFIFKIVSTSLFALIGIFVLLGCSSVGTSPNKNDKKGFVKSEQFNSKSGIFENVRVDFMKKANEDMKIWEALKTFVKGGKDDTPKEKMAQMKPNLKAFLEPSEEIKSIWFGHSTFLLNMNGQIVLVDPVFSEYAAPVSLTAKRFQAPVLELNELPKIDYIVISHDHYDHLDMDSIKFFKKSTTKFITPLGVGSHLVGWGISREKIIEKDWWESVDFGKIRFTATPAQHFSGRGLFDKDHTLWASWVIEANAKKVYFSGDSGYDSHFKEIGGKLGPFDVAYIESGQYNKLWPTVHMSPEEGVKAFKDLKAKKYFPVHWGMFKLSNHAWYEPVEKLYKSSKEEDFELLAPKIGQVISMNEKHIVEEWWVTNAVATEIGMKSPKLICKLCKN